MNEKRFTLAYEKGNWWAVKDGDITLWKEETIALLNSLNEENEQLKSEIKDLKFENEKKYRKIKQLEQMLQDVER